MLVFRADSHPSHRPHTHRHTIARAPHTHTRTRTRTTTHAHTPPFSLTLGDETPRGDARWLFVWIVVRCRRCFAGRWLHSMVVHEAQLFVFGGVVNAQTLLNDVWSYDYAQEAWHELESPSNPLLHHPFNSEVERDRLRRRGHYHPPGTPPEPDFHATPAHSMVRL